MIGHGNEDEKCFRKMFLGFWTVWSSGVVSTVTRGGGVVSTVTGDRGTPKTKHSVKFIKQGKAISQMSSNSTIPYSLIQANATKTRRNFRGLLPNCYVSTQIQSKNADIARNFLSILMSFSR